MLFITKKLLLSLVILYLIFYFICLWKLFKKSKEKGWKALIPLYNSYVLIKIAGLNYYFFLITILVNITFMLRINDIVFISINIIGIIINYFIFYNLSKKMHKEPLKIAFTGALLPFIMLPILALSNKYTYDKNIQVSPYGPIGDKKNKDEKYCLECGQKLKSSSVFCENCGKKVE